MTLKKTIASLAVLATVTTVASAVWVKIGGYYVWRSIGWHDDIKCSNISNNNIAEANDTKSFVITSAEALCRNYGGQVAQSHIALAQVHITDEKEFTDQLTSGKANTCTVDGDVELAPFADLFDFDCHNEPNWTLDVNSILVQSFRVVTVLSSVDKKGNTRIQYQGSEECYELPVGYSALSPPPKDGSVRFIQVPCI